MAVDARYGTMPAKEREPRRTVVERSRRFPRLLDMAVLTVCLFAGQLMRIAVTAGACKILEHVSVSVASCVPGMTIHASHGSMRSSQGKSCIAMAGERERRRNEPFNAVARLAFVLVPFFELILMNVLVTIQARSERRVIVRRRSFGRVALFAGDSGMLGQQRVARLRVGSGVERGRLESADVMTAGAIAAIRPARELIRMFVGVTVRAARIGHGNAEVRGLVTRSALQTGMTPGKRITGPAVIEIGRKVRPRCLPSARVVAATARRLKGSAVRITVTRRAIRKRNSLVPRPGVHRRHVTPLAQDLRV